MSYGYGAPPAPGYGAPPAGYAAAPPGYGAPPAGYAAAPPGYGAPPAGYGAPPAAPAAPAYGARPAFSYAGYTPANPRAWALFTAVDMDRSGSVSPRELQMALGSGGMTFNPRCIKMMIKMFDLDGSGTLSYPEFERLLATLEQWTNLFQSADKDRSGKLSIAEVTNLMKGLGFALPDGTLEKMAKSVDDDASGQLGYDELVLLMAQATALTNRFRAHDPRGAGFATLSYAQFLDVVFSSL